MTSCIHVGLPTSFTLCFLLNQFLYNNTSVFRSIILISSPIYINHISQKLMGVFHVQLQVSFLEFLIQCSRAKLNSRPSSDKAMPCFKPLSMGILEDKKLPILTLFCDPFKHALISRTNSFSMKSIIIIS